MARWLRYGVYALRALLMNRDLRDPLWDGGEIPPVLEPFHVGELLNWKGVEFRVGKVVGGDYPVLILVPVDLTHGAKLMNLRRVRDRRRAERREAERVRTESPD